MEKDGDSLDSLRAGFDQAGAMIKEFAPVLRSFFCSLTEEGFTKEEALTLTVEFLNGTILPRKG